MKEPHVEHPICHPAPYRGSRPVDVLSASDAPYCRIGEAHQQFGQEPFLPHRVRVRQHRYIGTSLAYSDRQRVTLPGWLDDDDPGALVVTSPPFCDGDQRRFGVVDDQEDLIGLVGLPAPEAAKQDFWILPI